MFGPVAHCDFYVRQNAMYVMANLYFDMRYCLRGIHLIWSIMHGRELEFLIKCS
jgi:hypothetical protein